MDWPTRGRRGAIIFEPAKEVRSVIERRESEAVRQVQRHRFYDRPATVVLQGRAGAAASLLPAPGVNFLVRRDAYWRGTFL